MQKTMDSLCIDIGGTFTDCYLRHGDKISTAKAPTTTYDLSVAFMRVIEDVTQQIGTPLDVLLKEIDFVSYSTTLAMNRLIERKGPRLGLITTRGFEDTILIGRGSQWQEGLTSKEKKVLPLMVKPEPLIPRELIVGARERVDSLGQVVMPLDENDFREKLRYLVDQGTRGFVVSLMFSYLNPVHERRIKEIIEAEYPDFYLGGMPVVLSSEVMLKQGEYARTMTTILNAYLQQSMIEELSHVTDRLRDKGYNKSLKMVHNTGGVAEIFSTMGVQTYNGGPIAGLIGSAYIAKLYGAKKTLVTDMGGTSFDMGMIVEGNPRFYTFMPTIDRWLVGITTLESRSIGAGGGTIAFINPMVNRLEVGPQSAGSMPGPACYDQGGEEPTVTDADLVLGYINPDFFHGGKIKLNRERAYESMKKIAQHLKVSAEEAALAIRKIVNANMGNALYKETVLRGFDPRDFWLFAYGGAGPTHCCGYNEYLGAEKILVFPYSSVFCAFGSSVMDIVRIYEQGRVMTLTEPNTEKLALDFETFNAIVQGLQERALRDLVADRVDPQSGIYHLELEMKFGGQLHALRFRSPRVLVKDIEDARVIYNEFLKTYSEVYTPIALVPRAGVLIQNFILHSMVPRPKVEFPKSRPVGTDPQNAFLRKRAVFWENAGDFRDTPTYNMGLLECGNIVEGPAIIEAIDTTAVIPEGKRYIIDEWLNGIIEKI